MKNCESFKIFKKHTCKEKENYRENFMGYSKNISDGGKFYLRTHRNAYKFSLKKEGLTYNTTTICYGQSSKCVIEEEFPDDNEDVEL